MMFTTYSFNKHDFQTLFGLNNLFIGFLDAFIYITLAIGAFLRYSIINSHNPVVGCLATSFPMGIGYAFIPIAAFVYSNNSNVGHPTPFIYAIFIAAAFCFGFFQLNFFPGLLTIFGHSFNIKNDGKIVGIWSSKSNAGNILGFLLSNVLVYQLKVRWEVTMIICASLLIIMSILLGIFIKNPDFKD